MQINHRWMNKPLLATSAQLGSLYLTDNPITRTPKIQQEDIAFIPVHGLLVHRLDHINAFFGATSYEDLRFEIQSALENPTIKQIILDIDSGGGEVNGLFDLVDFIYEARQIKPITALVNENAYSAAYAIASSCAQIIAPRTAGVGSIGVIVAHYEQSQAEQQAGIKITEVTAGNHKSDFSPHSPLSEQARESLQQQVDETYQLLISTISRNRNISQEDLVNTQAQTYSSSKAIELNLIDKIQSSHQFLQEHIMSESEEPENTGNIILTERARTTEILKLCQAAKMSELIDNFISQGCSIDKVRECLFDKLVKASGEEIINTISEKTSLENDDLIKTMAMGLQGTSNARI